jgi:hypothetical protein
MTNVKVGDVGTYHPLKNEDSPRWIKRAGRKIKVVQLGRRYIHCTMEGIDSEHVFWFIPDELQFEPRGHHLTNIFK